MHHRILCGLEVEPGDCAIAGHEGDPDAGPPDERTAAPGLRELAEDRRVRHGRNHDVVGGDLEQKRLAERRREQRVCQAAGLSEEWALLAFGDDAVAVNRGDHIAFAGPRVHADGLVAAPVSAGSGIPADLRLLDLLPSGSSQKAPDVEDGGVAHLDAGSIHCNAGYCSGAGQR